MNKSYGKDMFHFKQGQKDPFCNLLAWSETFPCVIVALATADILYN